MPVSWQIGAEPVRVDVEELAHRLAAQLDNKGLERRLASGTVDLLIAIDYPGFNMRAAAIARRHRAIRFWPPLWMPMARAVINAVAVLIPKHSPG